MCCPVTGRQPCRLPADGLEDDGADDRGDDDPPPPERPDPELLPVDPEGALPDEDRPEDDPDGDEAVGFREDGALRVPVEVLGAVGFVLGTITGRLGELPVTPPTDGDVRVVGVLG